MAERWIRLPVDQSATAAGLVQGFVWTIGERGWWRRARSKLFVV